MSSSDRSRVIGYVAINPPHEILCDGPACVVAGSQAALHTYLNQMVGPQREHFQIKKTRFGELLMGLSRGGAYAFDAKAYRRFYPLANRRGFQLSEDAFAAAQETTPHFVVLGG